MMQINCVPFHNSFGVSEEIVHVGKAKICTTHIKPGMVLGALALDRIPAGNKE